MVGVYRFGRWIMIRIGEWELIVDYRCRLITRGLGNDEGLDVEAPPKALVGFAESVGLEISLIPRQSKGCIGHLNHEEVEIGIGRRASGFNVHVFGGARRDDLDLRPG